MNTQIKKSAWAEYPDYGISIVPLNHSIQIKFNNVKIANSDKVLLLREQGFPVIYYFPREDIRVDLLYRTAKESFCPYKGDATHWALVIGDKRVEVAAWSYKMPFYEVKQIKNYFAFYPEVIEELIKV